MNTTRIIVESLPKITIILGRNTIILDLLPRLRLVFTIYFSMD